MALKVGIGSPQDGTKLGMDKLEQLFRTSIERGPKLAQQPHTATYFTLHFQIQTESNPREDHPNLTEDHPNNVTMMREQGNMSQVPQERKFEIVKVQTQVTGMHLQQLKQRQEAISRFIWFFLEYFVYVELQVRIALEIACKDSLKWLLQYKDQIQEMVKTLGMLYHGGHVDINIEKHPDFIKVISYVERLQDILDKLDDVNIKAILKETPEFRPDKAHLLASKLGLNKEGAEFLSGCDDYLTKKEWALEFLERKSKEKSSEEFTSWTKEFEKLGFIDVKAKVLGEWIDTTQPCPTYDTPLEWGKKEIESQFEYNILLNVLAPGVWNAYNPKRNSPGSDEFEKIKRVVPFKREDAGNKTASPEKENLAASQTLELWKQRNSVNQNYMDQEKAPMENVNYWFHGTDLSSAMKIHEGISGVGRPNLSFSHGKGFYLTSSLDVALEWALKNREQPAVVVFKLKDKSLFEKKGKGISWNEPEGSVEWRQAVRFFRSGESKKYSGLKNEVTAQNLLTKQYLFGPMVNRGLDGAGHQLRKDWEPEPKVPLAYQLCLKTENIKDKFHNEGQNVVEILHLLND